MALGQIFIMYILSSLIIGLLYSNIQQTNVAEQYTLATTFSLDMFGVLAFLNIGTYLKERTQFNREASAGYYYTSAYYIATSLLSVLVYACTCVPMCAIIYYFVGFPTQTIWNFFRFTLVCYVNLLTYQGLVEWQGASFTDLDSALLITGTDTHR
jgi:hypothetical protein